MKKEDLKKYVDQEVSWLHYYGSQQESEEPNKTTRKTELYNDVLFYDRLISKKKKKKVIPLHMRCPAVFITSIKPVLESSIEELEIITGPRNHENNIFTPLEYAFYFNLEYADKLKEMLKS